MVDDVVATRVACAALGDGDAGDRLALWGRYAGVLRAGASLTCVRRWLAGLLAVGAAAVTVAVAQEREPASIQVPVMTATPAPAPLPPPDAALPRRPAALAATLTATTRRLRTVIERWDPADPVPDDVTHLALHHQRILRLMTTRRRLGDATLRRLARDVRGEARDTVSARRHLAAIPRSPGRLPRLRVADAAPAADLRRYYTQAQRRFGV